MAEFATSSACSDHMGNLAGVDRVYRPRYYYAHRLALGDTVPHDREGDPQCLAIVPISTPPLLF
jgi:hypothetical protein